jgi:polar amino acid transport system substrate-binding protein
LRDRPSTSHAGFETIFFDAAVSALPGNRFFKSVTTASRDQQAANLEYNLRFGGSILDSAIQFNGFTMIQPTEEILAEISPTGSLRAAINLGNPVLVQKDTASGALSGVTIDLSRELARRLGRPLEFVEYPAAGQVVEAMARKKWDYCFLAIEPVRAKEIDFTAPYVLIEGSYLVPADSPLREIADVDRPGVRIAVGPNAAYDLFLSRTLKHATLVRATTGGAAAVIDRFLTLGLDAAAGIRQPLLEYAKSDPNVRVLDGRFMQIRQAMGLPRGRPASLRYLHAFIEEMKQSGFVGEALKRSGQADAEVAPLGD